MLQIEDPAQVIRTPALWRLGFRPLFLGGAGFVVVAISIWLGVWFGFWQVNPFGGVLWWHMHEMLFAFVVAIIAGFLLTAVQTWTSTPGLAGWKLAGLVGVWLGARVALGFDLLNANLQMLLDLLFLPLVAVVLSWPVVMRKQWRNLVFLPILLALTWANGLMHLGLAKGDYVQIQQGAYGAVLLVLLVMNVLASRVIPFFTARGLDEPKHQPPMWLECLAGVPLLLLALQQLSGFTAAASGLAAVLAGSAALGQLLRSLYWQPQRVFSVALLWSLHLSYLFVPLGLALLVPAFLGQLSFSPALHALTAGAMGGLILAMMARVSLGHTGRSLQPPRWIKLAFALVLIGAGLRVAGSLFSLPLWLTYGLAGSIWALSFALFLICYGPMLCQPRVDGRNG